MSAYTPASIEKKWKKYWEENEIYKVYNDDSRPKYYVLDMFPYPSGEGLHVGHPLGYIASDIIARYKRLQGYNVLHPMGFDAFGLPAEQYAIQMGVHPAESTRKNIARYREQLDNIGFSYDWSRSVTTSDPSYYRWTQWIFLQLFEHYYHTDAHRARPIATLIEQFSQYGTENLSAFTDAEHTFTAAEWRAMDEVRQSDILMDYRLAYRTTTFVNWCEELGTVLANDEVKEGVSERGGFPVVRKPMLQWSLRLTAYADRLLQGLEDLDWTDAMKKMQAHWVGRSQGAKVLFEWERGHGHLEVFTTRPDTIFGVTFMVLAPEHEMVQVITSDEQRRAVSEYIEWAEQRSEIERMSDTGTITGVHTGAYVLHPFTQQKIPVWISDYVLKDYGTGAIMAVPGGDDRDHAFASHFGLDILKVTDQSAYPEATRQDKVGTAINSDFLNGLSVPAAIEKAIEQMEVSGIGTRKINYRLRDAIFSRQRYWGEPFPIVYDESGVPYALSEEELPVTLPDLQEFKPASGGKSPLARNRSWVELPNGYTRETDTMPGFAGSSWYFLRYMDPHNPEALAGKDALQYWRDVDVYTGGAEHAVGHLLYARFWNKFLYDLGLVPTREPFRKLINQGMIQGVVETIYLDKSSSGESQRFVCEQLANVEMDTQQKSFAQIPVHIDFVSEYGNADSHLSLRGIQSFIQWRNEFEDAVFETADGRYAQGKLTGKVAAEDFKLYTHSEVGKMSKRYYNVINPDDVVAAYGADCFRMYEMFLGPLEQSKPWDTQGIDGVSKFLRRLWSLFYDEQGQWLITEETPAKEDLRILHTTIQRVQDDLERFSFNTCVSHFMICVNELKKLQCHKRLIVEPLVVMIAPFAPFISEELWHALGQEGSVHRDAHYPIFEEKHLKSDTVQYPISINGKKRALAALPSDADKEQLEKLALAQEEIQKWLKDKSIRKVIVVPGRMINIVVS